jgi:PAS domain S-box-containing protein
VAIWEEDFSPVLDMLDELRRSGITDLRGWLDADPGRVDEAVRRVRVIDVNDRAVELFEATDKRDLLSGLEGIFLPETANAFIEELMALWEGRGFVESESVVRTLRGRRLDVTFTIAFHGDRCQSSLITIQDTTAKVAAERALQAQRRRFEALNDVARTISSDLALEKLVQRVTDAARELTGAKYGAFFYNVTNDSGEALVLYTLSGAPREAFEDFGMPRNTAVFEPTFRGTGVVRSDDIHSDPRYGKNAPHYGMPKGHLPVVSYLAVPVISRSGEVLGGLFFGHPEPGVFTDESEMMVQGIAAHASIAIDNARLHQAAQREIETRRKAELAAQHLAAIVASSHDAIVSKDLDGTILSWNAGAERLFGYPADEAVGKPITILIPEEHIEEETMILGRIRRGERTEDFETVRRHKDGRLIDISLTVSPVKDADGNIVAASKIARDISERKHARQQRELLLREMSHRVKNLFAVAGGLVAMSARHAATPQDLSSAVRDRLSALAQAHELARPGPTDTGEPTEKTTLHGLIGAILAPYAGEPSAEGERFVLAGRDFRIGGSAVADMALVLHELATNAAKYGALTASAGTVRIDTNVEGDELVLEWTESGGALITAVPDNEGFGNMLLHRVVVGRFGGQIARDWRPEGLAVRLSLPVARLAE